MKYYIFCRDIGQFRAAKGNWVTRFLEEAEVHDDKTSAQASVNGRRFDLYYDLVMDEDEALILELLNQ